MTLHWGPESEKKAVVLCGECKRRFQVRWTMALLGARFNIPVACPHCQAIHDDVVVGAVGNPQVSPLD
jgi:hypothetical protein